MGHYLVVLNGALAANYFLAVYLWCKHVTDGDAMPSGFLLHVHQFPARLGSRKVVARKKGPQGFLR